MRPFKRSLSVCVSGCGLCCFAQPSVGGSSAQHWGPALGGRVAQGPLAPQGTLQLRSPSQCLTATCGCGTRPFLIPPLLPVPTWLPLYIPSYRGSVRSSSGGSRGWLLCNLVLILMWSWEEAISAFTYSAIFRKSLLDSVLAFIL